jgi:predicted ATPase
MKIAISGTQCIGKSTLINDMLQQWPNYELDTNCYRKKIKEEGLVINQDGDESNQEIIRDALIDQVSARSSTEKVLFDRCILDNLAYTIWLAAKGKVSDNFVERQIPIIRETFSMYDILFFIPLTEQYPVDITEGDNRDVDPIFRQEIDNIMKALLQTYHEGSGKFFPKENCPAIIEIFGSPLERIAMMKLYLKEDGSVYGEEESIMTAKTSGPVEPVKLY